MSEHKLINGVDVTELGAKAKALKGEPELAQFKFRATNKWESCGLNHTYVTDFYGTKQTIAHRNPFTLVADEPPVLLGGDDGANPVEHLLHALISCLTTSMVYHAAVKGIKIEALESEIEGEIYLRGFMGLEPDVRKGYQNIKITWKVKSDAPPEKLEEFARFSPVFDVVTNGTKVELNIEKA